MKTRHRLSLPVSAVSLAIVYVYVSTVFVFVDRWFGLTSSPGIVNAVVFTAVAATCGFSYGVAVVTDPGRVLAGFVPDVEDKWLFVEGGLLNPDYLLHEIKGKGNC